MNVKYKWIALVTGVIILCFLIFSCGNNSREFQGYVEGDLIFIASPFSGVLKKLNIVRGQQIKLNNLLFSLDPQPEYSQFIASKAQFQEQLALLEDAKKGQRETVLAGIQAQLTQAEAEFKLAQTRLDRNAKLYAVNAVEKDALDASEAEFHVKHAQVSQVQANLAEAKLGKRSDLIAAQLAAVDAASAEVTRLQWVVQQKQLYSPKDALVFDTFFREGEFVSSTTPILALLAPQNIYIIFFIPEPWLSRIHVGDKVSVECESCEQEYTATVSYISPEAEYTPPLVYSRETNYKYIFRARAIPNLKDAYRFRPGQPVIVHYEAH